ncbi:MAG: beta-L-arabinofuranosidase domain-containing protein [Chitinophagaceae bacterium]
MKIFKNVILVFLISLQFQFINAQIFSLNGEWKFAQGDNKENSSPAFNDANWKTVDAGAMHWDKKSLSGSASYYLWLRKKIVIPSSLKNELNKTDALALYLGKIQEEDDAYLNGKRIGTTTSRDLKRAYLLPENEILWDKENTIAIRILHRGFGSGVSEEPSIHSASPDVIFSISTDQKGATPKQQVNNKAAVYKCIIQNKLNKKIAANITANFYDDSKHILKSIQNKITLKPGENIFSFPYQTANSFLKIEYDISIPWYNYTVKRNAEYGYSNIVYKATQPLIANKVKEYFTPASLQNQTIQGWLGEKMKANKDERLYKVDEAALLAGYINKPGAHPWIGEHVGKFLEAACNTYLNTYDAKLKIQIDRTAQQLIASQLEDGYLGTYKPESHWTSWDVWSHKYNIIGLLSYYQLSGYKPALVAAEKAGNLLCSTFGNGAGQLNIITAGLHVGMAATSVLDPMVDLYRFSGDKKYLDFCYYIVSSFDNNNGPRIISTLDSIGRVDKTANAKAYEMLSNLVGLIKLYKATNDQQFLTPVLNAWKDITNNRLYITGTTSSFEHFQDDHLLPASAKDNMGEGCVTTTWLQLNYNLLSLFGKMEYLDELERSVYNHLTGAENPQTGCVSYYTPLMGVKPYRCNITCCMSSVPRGIAMVPLFANGKMNGSPSFLFYQPGIYKTNVSNHKTAVEFITKTTFPEEGNVTIDVQPANKVAFEVMLRKPYWADDFTVSVNGIPQKQTSKEFVAISRTWSKGDKVNVHFTMPVKLLEGGISYPGSVAFQRGPQILVYDKNLNTVSPDKTSIAAGYKWQIASNVLPDTWVGSQAYKVQTTEDGKPKNIILVPYADAGQTGGEVVTWLKKN